jgi:hypothetical protein
MKNLIFALLSILITLFVGCTETTVVVPESHDFDGDGYVDAEDNCPTLDNPLQENVDGDLLGDVCDDDATAMEGDFDGDTVSDSLDNCPTLDNPLQENWDEDALGDVCDDDDDNDDIFDAVDNCRLVENADQADIDLDFQGDACDTIDSRSCPDTISAHECGGGWVLCDPESIETVPTGALVMAWDGSPAVYYLGSDGRRYVFPNMTTYFSWFPQTGECPVIRQISSADLASVLIGGNVTIRPGTFLVKITTDPKVYAITRGGVLHWVESEAVARDVYGANWATEIVDVPDSFFVNYSVGAAITSASDYNRFDVFTGTLTIGQNLGLDP